MLFSFFVSHTVLLKTITLRSRFGTESTQFGSKYQTAQLATYLPFGTDFSLV
jgi:hypothetical protein